MLNKLFHSLWSSAGNRIHTETIKMFQKNKDAAVLDLGCDNGGLISKKVQKGIGSTNITGVDIDPQKLNEAEKCGIKTVHTDLNQELPFTDNTFSVVHANQVIEHLKEIDLFIQEIYRVLKPGGYTVIATENLSSWHNILALVCGWQAFSQHISHTYPVGNPFLHGKREKIHNWKGEHRRIFTLKGLKELMQAYGFVVRTIKGVGYYPFPSVIENVLSRIDPYHSAFIIVKAEKPF